MKTARKNGFINFQGQMLLSPSHDNVEVVLLKKE